MDTITLSHAAYADFIREAQPTDPYGSNLWLGMKVEASNVFPTQHACSQCDGSGEGQTSTYCCRCAGAGHIKTIGMVTGSRPLTMITAKLPRRFDPYFPADLVGLPPLCRGLA